MAKRWLWFALLVGTTFLLTRCGDKSSNRSRSFIFKDPGTFTDIYTNTISTGCVQCHQPGGTATADNNVQLDFTSQASAFSGLTSENVNGSISAPKCPSVPLVVSADPTDSYLMGTLFPDYYKDSNFDNSANCAPYQHGGQVNLSADEKNSILLWIQNGIPNN